MKRMIIVTGMDNSGKTTLCGQLSNLMGRPIVNSPGPVSKEEQVEWLIKQFLGDELVIHERFPLLEEMVYGPILRGKSLFDLNDQYFKALAKQKPLIIYTRPSNDTIINFGDREQMKGVIENSYKLIVAYDDLMFKLLSQGWDIFKYDYQKHKPEQVIEFINVLDEFDFWSEN